MSSLSGKKLTEKKTPFEKAVMRMFSLNAPGVYDIVLIVRPDDTRELIVKNQGQPHPIEFLG